MTARITIIFIFSFLFVTAILQSHLISTEIRFWLRELSPQSYAAEIALPLPLSKNKAELPLGNDAILSIPKLNVNVPIIFGISTDRNVLLKELESGVVRYPTSQKPGENGLAIILGHSSVYPWYRGTYGTVFALLNKLEFGDQFYVIYSDGQRFTFVIKDTFLFNPYANDGNEKQYLNNTSHIILVSCWPVGTSYRRLAIHAEQK